jgi:hypothetical protein
MASTRFAWPNEQVGIPAGRTTQGCSIGGAFRLVAAWRRFSQITAAIADEALRHAVLPRALETGSLGLDAEAVDRVDDISAKLVAPAAGETNRFEIGL